MPPPSRILLSRALITLTVAFCFPNAAATQVSPYQLPLNVSAPPRLFAVPSDSVGNIRLHYGEYQIPVYLPSSGDRTQTNSPSNTSALRQSKYYYLPFVTISIPELETIYKTECASETTRNPFLINILVEIGSTDAITAVAKAFGVDHTSISIFPYSIIELIDTYKNRDTVLWRHPRNPPPPANLTTTTNNFPKGHVLSLTPVTCDTLRTYITNVDSIRARAIMPTAKEARSLFTLKASSFLDHVLTFDLDQQAGALGQLEIHGISTTHGATPSLLMKLSGGGLTWVNNTHKDISKDTRTRWINRNALRNLIESYRQSIRSTLWCDARESNCAVELKEMNDKIVSIIDQQFSETKIQLLRSSNEDTSWINNYLIVNQDTVDRMRTHSFNPSFSDELGIGLNCGAVAKAAVSPLSDVAQAAGSPTTNARQPPPELEIKPPKSKSASSPSVVNDQKSSPKETSGKRTAIKKSPTTCGLDSATEIMDGSDITWKYKGKEWIPTDIDLFVVDNRTFGDSKDIEILRAELKGEFLAAQVIPLIRQRRRETFEDIDMLLQAYGQGVEALVREAAYWRAVGERTDWEEMEASAATIANECRMQIVETLRERTAGAANRSTTNHEAVTRALISMTMTHRSNLQQKASAVSTLFREVDRLLQQMRGILQGSGRLALVQDSWERRCGVPAIPQVTAK